MIVIPSITVLVPSYNSERTIGRALSSVLAQTLPPMEVIVIDDGSTDGTVPLVKSLCHDLPRDFIKVVELGSNHGAAQARNVGWEMAAGDLLAFLDSDDSWHPQKLQVQAGYMAAHDDIALTSHKCVSLSEHQGAPALPAEWDVTQIRPWQLMVRCQFSTPSVMLRTEIPQRFVPGERYCEDRHLFLQIALAGHHVARLELVLAYLYKAAYGEGGLSSHLWEFEKGELAMYGKLRRKGFLTRSQETALKAWSLAKYARRVCVARMR